MEQRFSQFSVGELEAGARKRQGLAEARRHAQAVGRSRRRQRNMRAFFGFSLLAFMAIWICVVLKYVVRGRQEVVSREIHDVKVREPTVSLSADLNGWDLVEKLYYIGLDNPGELARLLEEEDPFKVAVDSPDRFQCPTSEAERFSLPDRRDHASEEAFKAGKGFIYYQHLRKAGGTGFCEMASRNMLPREVPNYHCMPDDRGAMATPPWSNQDFFFQQMRNFGYRITANEWDAFPMDHLHLPGAVFATTFRHPVDRWYSQYRFEHVEHRDGSKADKPSTPFNEWYRRMRPYIMGDNYYVKTFCGQQNPPDEELMQDKNKFGVPKHEKDLSWSYHKFNSWGDKVTFKDLKRSMEILQRFHLILVLDFVDDEMWALKEALGWEAPRKQVLPHERQAVRANKKSISAKEALPSEVWSEILNANVFDVLLFHWAKRMYLERSACRSFDQEAILKLPPKIGIQEESDGA
eukprot:g15749.t1